MGIWEKLLWVLSFLGLLLIPLFNITVKESYFQDEDIQIEQPVDWKAQQEALKSILKYIRSPKEREAFRREIERMKKKKPLPKRVPPPQALPSSLGVASSSSWIRQDTSSLYLPPNTHVSLISKEFKMKYASSLKETFRVLRQAGSRFIQTKEGPRPLIQWVQPGSIIYRLGFRPGDIILRVNGRPVNSVRSAKDLYYALRNDSEYLVEVLRQGKVHRFVFKIQD